MPDGIRLAFEKVFQPLPATPRRVSEAEGSVHVEQAHDVRPIDELLHGVWKGKTNDVDIRLTFPDLDTDSIQWTVDFGQGIPVVEAKLSRINYPAKNSVRLWMQPSNLSNVDEKDIVGNVRRGPDSSLLVHYRGPGREVQKWIETHSGGSDPENAWQHQVTSNTAAFSIAADSHRQPELVWGAEKDGLQAALEIRAPLDSGSPSQAPGVAATTQLVPMVHVKNVSDKSITLTSETGRADTIASSKSAAGRVLRSL